MSSLAYMAAVNKLNRIGYVRFNTKGNSKYRPWENIDTSTLLALCQGTQSGNQIDVGYNTYNFHITNNQGACIHIDPALIIRIELGDTSLICERKR